MSELDRLLGLAAQAEPDELTPQEIDSEVGLAQITGRARHRAWVRRRLFLASGIGTALAAAAVLVVMLGPSLERTGPAPTAANRPAWVRRSATAEPRDRTDLELPTGDRLLATRGARFRVEQATLAERRIRLLSGTMLFDVRPSASGRFYVETGDAHVMVVGTVFTVSVEPSGTIVRVYEGRVEVTYGDSQEIIAAGESSSISTGIGQLDTESADLLADDAERAANRRRLEPLAAAQTSAQAPSTPRRPATVTAREAREWIAHGHARRALRAAREQMASGESDPWALIEADALRAMGQRRAAARAYTRAAAILPTPRREQAGFTGARLHASATEALHALDVGRVSEPGSPLRERGLAMRADLLERLGRDAERSDVARIYLRNFPNGSRAESLREDFP